MERETTCCFTGHRPDKLPWRDDEWDPRCQALKERLTAALEEAYDKGMRHFICGMAKGAKFLNKDINVYSLLGDGELAEGQIWEATMFAAHYHLDNLCIIVDLNGLQIDGRTCDVMNTAPVDKKFEAFGCNVISINGHDFADIEKAMNFFHANHGTGKPTAILMTTVKGKGVSYMENQAGWHGKAPNDEEYAQAMAELAQARKAIEEA